MFRTELPLTPHPQQLPPSARVLTIGSCFSDTIGSRLTEFKVATMVNPFGTVFNPISACKLLRAAAGEDMDWQQHLVEARGRWQNHDLHAELGADTPVELLQRIQTMTREAGVFLATADVVVLTLGSAFAYRLLETEEIISNCHKIPAEKFDKELLTADDIIAAVAETHAYLRRINPKLRFILTVSPVRHVKDTLVLNSASKAMLRVACHYLSELLPDVTYFPAYELLMDDLRDYRFYASDMLHPSEVAENYVWERFTRTYFDATFGRFKKEWEGIRQSLNHRPLYPAAPEHREFLEATLERLRKVAGQADVRMELLHVERELANLPLPVVPAAPEPEDYDDGEERIDIGSFDEEPAVAAAPAATVPPAPTPAAAPKPAPVERKPVRTPEPREDSEDDDATDRGQARILRPGFGVLLEDEDEEQYDDNQPAATPTETLVTPESAYDQAYSAAALAESEQDDSDAETEGEPEHRKKRRSRGGAKRTKRKNARLAAEQTSGELQPESSVVAVQPVLPAPADETAEQSDDDTAADVVYVTEEELRRPRRNSDSEVQTTPELSTAPEAAAETSATNEEAPAEEATGNRRSRNNRRGGKRESTERSGGRGARQPLYAAETEAPAASELQVEPAPTPAAAEALATLVAAVAVTAELPTESATATPAAPESASAAPKKKPAARRKPAAKTPAAKPAQTTEPQELATEQSGKATTAVTPAPAATPEAAPVPVAPEAAAKTPAAKKPARRKPAAKPKPAAAATQETVTPAPAPTAPLAPESAAPVKAAPRKRAPAKPKAKPAAPVADATPAAPAPTVVQPEAKPKAVATSAAKATPASKPKATAKTPVKAKTAAASKAAAQSEEAPSAKPATKAKAPAKPRKTAPTAAKSEPAEKPTGKKPAAKSKAKAPARKKATPEPPAAENN